MGSCHRTDPELPQALFQGGKYLLVEMLFRSVVCCLTLYLVHSLLGYPWGSFVAIQ
jgi:hypothetical protein